MPIKQIYRLILSLGLILWILETAYFGWNMTAQSGAERVFDIITSIAVLVGGVGSLAISVTEEYLKSITKRD